MPTFTYTGAEQTYVVPTGITSIVIECWGAEGGSGSDNATPIYGGYGGYSKGNLTVTPGETLYIYVGGKGADGFNQNTGMRSGGFNGGGAGYSSNPTYTGAGGGGASDVRQGGNALANRKIVAGGGGGGNDGGNSRSNQRDGGDGGGNAGGAAKGSSNTSGVSYPQGGTQSAGGAAGAWSFSSYTGNNGALGVGGSYPNTTYPAGGGGGGYYGGGSGQYISGGGGSGYVGGVTSSTNTTSTRTGNGQVIITPANSAPTVSNLFSSVLNPSVDSSLTWTYSDTESNSQAAYQIGWRKNGSGESHNFTNYDSGNAYHIITAGTLEEGVAYDWAVRVKDSVGAWSPWVTGIFSTISPINVESVVNLATAEPNGNVLGSSTVTNNYSWSGSTWTRIQPAVNSVGARFYVPLQYLTNGQTYTIALTIANAGGASTTVDIDWCDATGPGTQTLAANEVKRVNFNGTRSVYDSTYRFLDVAGPSGADILVKDILIAPRANKNTAYFNGNSSSTQSVKYYWLGTPGSSPSVKEVFAYENSIKNPRFVDSNADGLADGYSKYAVGTYTVIASPWGSGNAQRFVVGANGQDTRLFYTSNPISVSSSQVITFISRYSGPGRIYSGIEFSKYNAGGYLNGSYKVIAPDANGWVIHTAIVPSGAAIAAPMYYTGSAGLSGDTHITSSWLCLIGDYSAGYFDGSSTNSTGLIFNWTGAANDSTSTRVTYNNWTELTEVSSATASGIINATSLTKGDYEVEVATQDADGIWGPWSAAETFALGPATNIKTRTGGVFTDTVRMVRQGGVWVPAAVTKTRQGGVFI